MIDVAVTMNHVRVVIQVFQEHDCAKLEVVNRVTGLIIIKLSRCVSYYFPMPRLHRTISLFRSVEIKPQFSGSRRDCQCSAIVRRILNSLKLPLHNGVQENLLFFRVRWVKGRTSLENSSTNHLWYPAKPTKRRTFVTVMGYSHELAALTLDESTEIPSLDTM